MAIVREKICAFTGTAVTGTCDDCGQPIKLAIVIEWRSYQRELCRRCAEDLRTKLTQVLHAGRAPRRRKRKPRSGGTQESWDDAT